MWKIICIAHFTKEGDAVPCVIELNGMRFFSLSPKSKEDEDRINAAALGKGSDFEALEVIV